MGVPIKYNLRNLVERKGTTLMTAIGIGADGRGAGDGDGADGGAESRCSRASGNPLQMLVLRKGTDAELTSQLTADAYQIIRRLAGHCEGGEGRADGVARRADGRESAERGFAGGDERDGARNVAGGRGDAKRRR